MKIWVISIDSKSRLREPYLLQILKYKTYVRTCLLSRFKQDLQLMINIAMENAKTQHLGRGEGVVFIFSKVLSFFFNDCWFPSFKIICSFATQPFPSLNSLELHTLHSFHLFIQFSSFCPSLLLFKVQNLVAL